MNFEEILDDLGMTIAEFYAGIIALGAIVVSLVIFALVVWNFSVFYFKITGNSPEDYDDDEDY